MTIPTQRSHRIASLLALPVMLLGLAACDTKDDPSNQRTVGDSAAFQDTTAFQNTPPLVSDSAAPAPMVEVFLTEYEIRMPSTVAPGATDFVVKNSGTMRHNFEIEGNGVEAQLPQPLGMGEIRTIRVNLTPGKYEVYCPVEDHADKGMKTELTVQ